MEYKPLTVDFSRTYPREGEAEVCEPESWYVRTTRQHYTDGGTPQSVVVKGFQRKKDAECACEALLKLEIDWDADRDELYRQVKVYGGGKKLKQEAMQNLQW